MKKLKRQTKVIVTIGPATESEESLAKRVDKAAEELEYASQFDVVLVNDDLEKAKEEAFNLISDFAG